MAQRRQIRVSRSLEGEGERPATGYGEPEAGAPNLRHDRLKPALREGFGSHEPALVTPFPSAATAV
jgi:hypothetical protein